MKTAVLFAALALASTAAFAAGKPAEWDCQGGGIENAGVSLENGKLMGEVQWDCFPGDGICTARTPVTVEHDGNGDLVYRGKAFWMIVHVSQAAGVDGYKAHAIATDEDDAADEGRGFKYDDFLTCTAAGR
jgi:hypothetical protein